MNSGPLPEDARFIHRVPATPLVPVVLDPEVGDIWCKLEFLNPSGSTKDRIARHILEKAWRRGEIGVGSTVVEASSGSTSIALALACSQMGLKFVAFIPDSATSERELIVRAFGGEVRRVSGGMSEVLRQADEVGRENGWFPSRQFANPDNVEAHRLGTAAEILTQIPGGCVDGVVSGVGTGGTLQGLFEAFAAGGCNVRAFAAIPRESEVFGGNIECCSLKFSSDVPGVVDGMSELYGSWKEKVEEGELEEMDVSGSDCLRLTGDLWSKGFPVGPSAGLNYAAALEVKRRLGVEAKVVTVLPDRMERYFSHKVFEKCRRACGD